MIVQPYKNLFEAKQGLITCYNKEKFGAIKMVLRVIFDRKKVTDLFPEIKGSHIGNIPPGYNEEGDPI